MKAMLTEIYKSATIDLDVDQLSTFRSTRQRVCRERNAMTFCAPVRPMIGSTVMCILRYRGQGRPLRQPFGPLPDNRGTSVVAVGGHGSIGAGMSSAGPLAGKSVR